MAGKIHARFAPIEEAHILQALAEIDRHGVPPAQRSHNWLLLFNGKSYPPKYVLRLASRFAPMEELVPSTFYGGDQTNDVFRVFGFEIVTTPSWAAELQSRSSGPGGTTVR